MIIYDFEVFKHDTLLGALNEETGEITQLWNIDQIREFTEKNLKNVWVGYNCEHYDKILLHGIYTRKLLTETRVFDCSGSIFHAQDSYICVFGIL